MVVALAQLDGPAACAAACDLRDSTASTYSGSSHDEDAAAAEDVNHRDAALDDASCHGACDDAEGLQLGKQEPAGAALAEKWAARWLRCLEACSQSRHFETKAFFVQVGQGSHFIEIQLAACVRDLVRKVLVLEGMTRREAARSRARLRTADGRLLAPSARLAEVDSSGALRLARARTARSTSGCGCSVRAICGDCMALGVETVPRRVTFSEDSD